MFIVIVARETSIFSTEKKALGLKFLVG